MAQQSVIGKHRTKIEDHNGTLTVRYWATDVGKFDGQTVTLNNGGYFTNTTKLRMNQTSTQYGLGFDVYQKNYIWYVNLPSGETREFKGLTMEFPLSKVGGMD